MALQSSLARETAARQESERAQEEWIGQEKRRLAKELHDTLGQSLTAIYFNTKFLERKLENCGPEATGAIFELGESIHLAVQELHGVMSRLLADTASTEISATEQGSSDPG